MGIIMLPPCRSHDDTYLQKNNRKGVIYHMLGHLEEMLLNGEITVEEYQKKKVIYVETLLELLMKDFITEEEFREKINK